MVASDERNTLSIPNYVHVVGFSRRLIAHPVISGFARPDQYMRLAELTGVSFDIYYFYHLLAPSQITALEIAASKDRASSVYICVLIPDL